MTVWRKKTACMPERAYAGSSIHSIHLLMTTESDTLPTTTTPPTTTTARKRKRQYTTLECNWCGITSNLQRLTECQCIMCIDCIDKVCITCQFVLCRTCTPLRTLCSKCKQCKECCDCVCTFNCTECNQELKEDEYSARDCYSCDVGLIFCFDCYMSEEIDDDYLCHKCSTVKCLSCGESRRRYKDSHALINKAVDLIPVTEICYDCKDKLLNDPNVELEKNTLNKVLNLLIDKTSA